MKDLLKDLLHKRILVNFGVKGFEGTLIDVNDNAIKLEMGFKTMVIRHEIYAWIETIPTIESLKIN